MKRSSSRTLLVSTAVVALLPVCAFGAKAPKGGVPEAVMPSPAVDAAPVASSSRMVTYTWDSNRSFVVRSLAGVNTDIAVPAGESIEGFYPSNGVDWHFMVTKDHKRVLMKPNAAGLYNTALVVTNKRTYQLTLIAVEPGQTWFQRVTWVIPGVDTNGAYWTADGTYAGASTGGPAVPPAPAVDLNPADMYFNYRISGNAAFRPVAVFDDGHSTWLRMDPKAQDMPAIFAITDGKLDVVNYTPHDGYIVVPRVAAELVLQLNHAKVTIRRGCDPSRCLK